MKLSALVHKPTPEQLQKIMNGLAAITLLLSTGLFVVLALTTPGTVDSADSIYHYFHIERTTRQFSASLNLWAKPFYTLVAAPAVALGGITGLKIFNLISAMLALAGATLAARKVGFKLYGFVPLIGLSAAGFPSFAFSGLTESFASLILIMSLLALLYKKPALGFLLASLLPFCRSEAKVLLPLFALYGMYHRQFRYLPLLLLGSVLFSLMGQYFLGDWSWIFNSPYKLDNDFYGRGDWLHYLKHLAYLLEWPVTILVFAATFLGLYKALKKLDYRWNYWLLFHVMAWTIVAAHTAVWALGIFGSAGLMRVLVLVLPIFFIMALEPVEEVYQWSLSVNFKYSFALIMLLSFGSFWAVHSYSGKQNYLWRLALKPTEEAHMIRDSIAPFIHRNYPHFTKVIAESPELGLQLNFNMLDSPKRDSWQTFANNPGGFKKEGVLLLWESRWAPIFYPEIEKLNQDSCFARLRSWQKKPDGIRFMLYRYRAHCSQTKKAKPPEDLPPH